MTSPNQHNPLDAPAGAAPGYLSTLARPLWRIVRIVLIAYLLMMLAMMLMEESMIFFPAKYPEGNWKPSGLPVEDASFEAADGVQLHGWYVPHDSPRAVVLFAHGNAGNITHRIDVLRELHRRGVAILAFDYRGYGRSSGAPSEAGVLADTRAARKWLAEKTGVREQDIVLMGESLGGVIAALLAAEQEARGLVIENGFSSAPDVAAHHYGWLPVRRLMRTRLDAVSAIANYHGPLLQVHAGADTIVPVALGEKLFAAANEPKRFLIIAGADHNDERTPEFYAALDEFISGLPH